MKLSFLPFLALATCLQAATPHAVVVTSDWQPATDTAPAAEPAVEFAPGEHYLFRASTDEKKPGTRVLFVTDPKAESVTGKYADALHLVAWLPITRAAVTREGASWFISGDRPGIVGRQRARLEWRELSTPTTATSRPAGIAVRVALYDDSGSAGKGVPTVFGQLGKVKDIDVTKLDADGIRAGLSGYDVVIFTGGSGSRQANTIGLLGREQVRRFVEAGGGYIGICAGAYLACDGFSWGVKVLDAKTPSSKWARGTADLQIEANDAGRKMLGLPQHSVVRYVNGPVLVPANNPAIPDFEPLVFFRTETAKNDSPVGAQIGTPAMARGAYGNGRVIACSPHPEQTAGMENWVEHAVRAVAPRGGTAAR